MRYEMQKLSVASISVFVYTVVKNFKHGNAKKPIPKLYRGTESDKNALFELGKKPRFEFEQ